MRDKICVQCGENERAIRLHKLSCGLMSESNESGPAELDYEYPRHRFKPYTKKELERFKRAFEY